MLRDGIDVPGPSRGLVRQPHYPTSPRDKAYGRMFGGAIGFEAATAELRFDAGYLALPLVRDDAALRRVLQRPIPLMARQYRQDRQLSQRIAGFIAESAGQPPDAEAIAARFNISVRTLQRQLREEETSVLDLTSRARRLRAEELLRRGDLPLKRVASLAGYRDESSFGRAFRRWTGTSPADFRRNGAPRAGIARSRSIAANCSTVVHGDPAGNAASPGPGEGEEGKGEEAAPGRLRGAEDNMIP